MTPRSSLVAALSVILPLIVGEVAAQGVEVAGVVRHGVTPVENAVVYLDGSGIGAALGEDRAQAVIDQWQLRFSPAVIVVQPGSAVEFLNSDGILHNVFSPGWTGEEFDLGTYPSGTSRTHTFREPGPHVILCHVHPEMAAYVVVVPTPHHVLTDAEGRFRISELAPGSYRLGVWHRGEPERSREVAVPETGIEEMVIDLSRSDHSPPSRPR